MHQFGDYRTYFETKHLKQQQIDDEYVNWDRDRRADISGGDIQPLKPIFSGCVVHVNGHTNPSISEIHRLIILHGGKFISFLSSKGSATHIICDRLTPRKKIEFRNYKVVRAQWVVDCIKKDTLLDWTNYRLIESVEYGQKRLDIGTAEISNEEEAAAISSDSDVENGFLPLTQQKEQDGETNGLAEDDEEVADAMRQVSGTGEKTVLDANHPDFLKHFFANSRLHHLSMWKADLRLKFFRRILKMNKSAKPKPSKRVGENAVIMHIDFDCFFATASCLNHPKLDITRDPIVVTHGRNSSDIASCNYVARAFGVKNGMWVSEARRLCPNIVRLDYDFDSYEKYSSEFYNYLVSYDIFDHIFPVSIDEVLIDATSYFESMEGDLAANVAKLSARIREDVFKLTKCTVSIGASHNVMLAKLSIRKAKPDGQFFLHDNVEQFLDPLSVKDLPGIGHSITEKLAEEIKNSSTSDVKIRELKELTKTRLMSVFGEKTGTKLFEYARGIDNTSLEIDTTDPEAVLGRKSISVDVNFGIRFETIAQLDNFLIRMSKELYSRLIALGICGSSLTLKLAKRAEGAPINPPKFLGSGRCEYISKSSRLGIPTNDWGIIGSELKAIYRMSNVPVKELRGISISMTKLKDVDTIKSSRQMQLPFRKGRGMITKEPTVTREHNKTPAPTNTLTKEKKEGVTSVLHEQFGKEANVDWEVFQALPWDIRREIQRELERRGLMVKTYSPVKAPLGTKSYMQQLIPTQIGSAPKYVRVLETITKSPTKSPSKSPSKRQRLSPIAKKESIYEDTQSYDSSILNELPSSVKNEVIKDIEYKKKIKDYDMTSLRDRITRKLEDSKAQVSEVSSEWLSAQSTLRKLPVFLNNKVTSLQMQPLLSEWVEMSLSQKGPHQDDIAVFAGYLTKLVSQNLNIALLLLRSFRKALAYHQSLLDMNSSLSEQDRGFLMEGIKDWNNNLNAIFCPIVEDYCVANNIDIDL
ncbi:DNA repair protein [Scheffersomyces xylosifermentans]|uniref:DNA repair protein n=1 Tax=Scheffersomyces xylosifermentans TaxID=1304137 RepID=UPI00315C6556